jgi:hypothetical protein
MFCSGCEPLVGVGDRLGQDAAPDAIDGQRYASLRGEYERIGVDFLAYAGGPRCSWRRRPNTESHAAPSRSPSRFVSDSASQAPPSSIFCLLPALVLDRLPLRHAAEHEMVDANYIGDD